VYFVEGLGHNLFSVGQFYDSDLEVTFIRDACFVRNLEGVDLLKGDRSTNLYTINLQEMEFASPICLMAHATFTKSWLWHQRLSHLNFDTINDIARNDLVAGLPKFKYHKEHLCPSCEQGKSKRASHPPKPVPNTRQRLHLLHMDLCGPMRIVSINRKRTMLIFSRAPLFLWAEAIATACFTQNRSIIHRRFNKTPYELINGRKPDLSFLHLFGALCYPKNDREDIGKLGAKGGIAFFIGYSSDSCAYRVYNRRTKKIMETINVSFDELFMMAFDNLIISITNRSSTIFELNKQLSEEKSTVSFLLEEKKRLKSDFKICEEKLLDKQILLEKRIKELNNIVLKTGQSIQTIHMLSPKPNLFYHTEHKMALDYQNPFYLKQAQKKQQSLNDGKVLLEKHDPPVVHDSEETLQLAQESREKMKQMNKEIKPANYTKINHLSGVFVPQKALSREELYFSNNSKTANVSKSFLIPNEDLSDDTTPSVARKFLNEVKSTIVTLQRVIKQRITIKTHSWASSAHQELHKIVREEIFPIVNQVDARLQNFEIQFLKEAAKFVGDFKSLEKEADDSLDKHKALELEIERLLKAVVSQDIMIIVQNESVVDTSDLQTELERTKERFENCIIKKETEYAKLWNDWYKKCDECKYDKILYDKAYKDMQQKIEWLQAQLGDLKEFQVLMFARENSHLKATYKNLFDSISVSRAQTKTIIASLQKELQSNIYKNAKLRTQLFKKVSDQKDNTLVTSENTKFAKQPIVENLPKVGKTNALSNPVTSNSISTPQESKRVNNDKVIALGMFRINPSKTSREEKHMPNTVSASARTKPITVSQSHVITKKDVNSDLNGLSSTGVDNTKTRRP
nr:Gag-Pol polyprotein [Tanacetum cinerariifolium]